MFIMRSIYALVVLANNQLLTSLLQLVNHDHLNSNFSVFIIACVYNRLETINPKEKVQFSPFYSTFPGSAIYETIEGGISQGRSRRHRSHFQSRSSQVAGRRSHVACRDPSSILPNSSLVEVKPVYCALQWSRTLKM